MSPRIWIKHRMPQPVEETTICARCGEAFQYKRVTSPRKYHPACARLQQLDIMRENQAWIREQNRKLRESANA